MAVSLRYFALSCFVFLALQQVANGITCYSCTSCGSTVNSWSSASSLTSGSSCFKYVYGISIISYTSRGVTTSCTAGSDGLGGTYYCCTGDNCNGGASLSSSLGLALALVAAVGVFKTAMTN